MGKGLFGMLIFFVTNSDPARTDSTNLVILAGTLLKIFKTSIKKEHYPAERPRPLPILRLYIYAFKDGTETIRKKPHFWPTKWSTVNALIYRSPQSIRI